MPDAPLSLTFLGTGNAFANGRYWSSFLVNDRVLFDPSPIALPHLKKLGKAVNDIDAVLISHFHADHWFGLPFLLLEYAEISGRSRPLTIVGPPGVEGRVRALMDLGFAGTLAKLHCELRWLEAQDGLDAEAAGLPFRAVEVEHAATLTCFGYRAVIDGRTLAFSGDTTICDALRPLAEGADAFVVECSCWEGACGPHLAPADIRELRRRIAPSTRFVVTHMDGGPAPFEDAILVADDLTTVHL